MSLALGAAIGAVLTQSLLPRAPASSPSYGGDPLAASFSRGARRDAGAPAIDTTEPLRHEALLLESERDLGAALRLATALTEPERMLAFRRLGDHWGGIDARRALAAAEDVGDAALGRLFRGYVLEGWVAVDPPAVLAYVPVYLAEESSGAATNDDIVALLTLPAFARDTSMQPVPSGVWKALAAADAYALLAAAERFPVARELAQQFAIVELARRDVRDALPLVERLSPASQNGNRRENFMYAIGHVYARSNLDAAWAWVRELDPQSEAALAAVMFQAAATDADRAVAWVLELALQENRTAAPAARRSNVATTAVETVLAMSPQHSADLADRFATTRNAHARVLLQTVLSAWSRQRPSEAFDWLLANRAQLGAEATFEAFQAFDDATAARDPDLVLRMLSELPRERRAAWIAPRIMAMTRVDRRRAEAFVDSLAGSAEHDAALTAFIEGLARQDPVAAARRVDIASAAVQQRASAPVAAAWARTDPAAAAAWTLRIAHPLERASAVYNVASAWAEVDPESAQAWLLAMPEGVARDSGLDVLESVVQRANVTRTLNERANALLPASGGAGQ